MLVATDGSEGADRAIDYAAHRAKDEGADLLIVNIIDGYELRDEVSDASLMTAGLAAGVASVALGGNADQGERPRQERGGHDGSAESRAGEVAQTIIEMAQEKGASDIWRGTKPPRQPLPCCPGTPSGPLEGRLIMSRSRRCRSPLSFC